MLLCFGNDIKASCKSGARILQSAAVHLGATRFGAAVDEKKFFNQLVKDYCSLDLEHTPCGAFGLNSAVISAVMRPPADCDGARLPEAEEGDPRAAPMMICARLAGRAIIRVVGRCEEAQENSQLDLSECQLMQVPDAVYHLMRHTELKSCDLSGNVITKIPPKFAVKFSLITDLNLSNNQMAKLPDELCTLACLERLDISHNTFVALPHIAFQCPVLHTLLAHHNQIIEVDVDRMARSRALEYVDLSDNPIPPRTHEELKQITRPSVSVSEREKEDWEEDILNM